MPLNLSHPTKLVCRSVLKLLLITTALSNTLGGDVIELSKPTVVSFPQGYDVIDHEGRVLNSLPDSRSATVKAYRNEGGTKLYISDWSWQRFQTTRAAPNYICGREDQRALDPAKLRAEALSARARSVIAEGDFEDGFRLLSEALELTVAAFGSDSLEAGHALYQAADLLKERELYDVAEVPYVRALEIFRKQLGDEAIETATLRSNVGSLYEMLGRFDEAEEQYLASKRVFMKTLGAEAMEVGIVQANLAGLYEKQQRFSSQEVSLLRALDILITHRGTNDSQVLQLRGRLATLYSKFTKDGVPADNAVPKSVSAVGVAKLVFPSVYSVTCYDSKGEIFASGSGFQVKHGLVATNHHVVEGAHRITVSLLRSGRELEVGVGQHVDSANDLVVLNVPEGIAPPLAIQPSGDLPVGVDVFAIGNPLGLEGTISQGIVSGFRDTGAMKLVQVTAAISPGNSGGPLVDSAGVVRGVVVASMVKGQNLNFAVRSEALIELLRSAP